MIGRPRVVGLVLCERMAINPAPLRLSLEGMFHALTFESWPAPAAFTVYAALQGGHAEGTMELCLTRLETEEDVYRYQRWFAFSDPHLTVQMEIPVRRCVFPGPGRYRFSLRFDGDELSGRLLDVFERNAAR
jgi:hypothetical protein